jgi:hypothetical protein
LFIQNNENPIKIVLNKLMFFTFSVISNVVRKGNSRHLTIKEAPSELSGFGINSSLSAAQTLDFKNSG